MVLPSRIPPDPAVVVRDVDPAWAERLAAEAQRFERTERQAGLRRAGLGLLIAIAVVVLGIAGFGYETNTRLAIVHPRPSPGYVTVTPLR